MFPDRYFYRGGNTIMSVNGSSEDGNCSLLATTLCNEPTTSVLQDGIIPTLTGLDGDIWASQLLTINTDSPTTDITFDFEATLDYVGVERVEVVMFNCPEWGISVDRITLRGSTTPASIGSIFTTISPTITSCDSLVRVCISRSFSSTLTALTLRFQLSSASTWVHLAEVSLYGAGPTCPPDTILNQTPPPTTSDATSSILPTTTWVNTDGCTTILLTSAGTNTAGITETKSLLTSSLIVVSSVLFFIVLILATIIIILSLLLRYKKYQHTSNTDTPLNHGHNVKHKSDGADSTIEGEKEIYEQLQISVDDMGVDTGGVSDHQYMEIETRLRRGNTFVLRDNESYTTWK